VLRQPVYTFLFDRRSLALLLAGSVAAAALLFVGGLLLGLSVNLDEKTVAAVGGLGARQPVTVPAAAGEAPADGEAAGAGGGTAGTDDAGDTGDGGAPPAGGDDASAPAAPPADWVPFEDDDTWPNPDSKPGDATTADSETGAGAAPAVRAAARTERARPAAVEAAARSPWAAAKPPNAPAAAPHAQPPVAPEIAAFTVQVAAFAVEGNARRLVDRLERRGYEPYVVELAGRRRLLAVRFGRWADADAARQAADGFRTAEGAEAIVVPSAAG
jgi:cell division septation protein DedD